MTNEKLGQLFNISYSAISHSVKIFKEKMNNDKKVKNQFEKINSQFNGLLPKSLFALSIVVLKITFRFKDCMQRLIFRANSFGDI